MIPWKQARERGLKWVRTIRAEAKIHPSLEFWVVNELVLYDSGEQGWRYQSERDIFGGPRRTCRYENQERAQAGAAAVNARLAREEEDRAARAAQEASERLQRAKEAEKQKRLRGEEDLMRAAAVDRHRRAARVPEEDVSAPGASVSHLKEIVAATREMPYLRRILCRSVFPYRVYRSDDGAHWELDRGGNSNWTSRPTARAEEFARRAPIAEGFGLDPEANWAVTKAAIRKILKPRANELLEQASVRRLLDEALAEGKLCLVWGDVVFWYEARELRWTVKEVAGPPSKDRKGSSLWLEGTILSTNHGRIIVLPYRKEDGTEVRGHTKNSREDGPAMPRHHSQYVEIPFERLDGDLMVGLHGELPYE